MKILIAEDDFTSRTMLQAVLTKWGYEVTATPDGEDMMLAPSRVVTFKCSGKLRERVNGER